jgi:uncharacterized protein (DUF2336 family)
MRPAVTPEPAPSLDISVFLEVIESGDAAQRTLLASQLAAFLSDPETAETERAQVTPAVLKLAVDSVADVRRALAEGVAFAANLHADIVFSIIADEDDIALPFLAATPSLNAWHMQAILRVGDVQRQMQVALRPDITNEAVSMAVKTSPPEPCMALFENPSVRFSDWQYHILYERFGKNEGIVEHLLSCPDLPLDIRIMQAKRASSRMHMLMTERGWLSAHDAADVVADAEENAILRILVEGNDEELQRTIPFLISKSLLTASILVRAAACGDMHVVEWALAYLSGVGRVRTREMMAGRGLGGFKALHSKSGLPQSSYGLLQAACDVAREAGEEGITLDPHSFGRRLIEALMTGYESMPASERGRHLDVIARYADDRVRLIAKRLKADFVRAA